MNNNITFKLIKLFLSNFLILDKKTSEKSIYLTFDDGPTEGVTNNVIKILNDFNVNATFFCTGENIKNNPELFQMIKENGNVVGNHSYSHLNGWKHSLNDYVNDVEKANEYIQNNIFRPPFGKISLRQLFFLKKKYSIIMWSVMSDDFKNISKEKCLKNVLKKTKPGCILVFHDSKKAADNCLYVLPKFIEHFLKKEFTFELL